MRVGKMNIDIFMEKLTLALIERGVPENAAAKHTSALRQSFDSEDLVEIEAMNSSDEIESLADSLSAILKRKNASAAPPATDMPAASDANVQPKPMPATPPAEVNPTPPVPRPSTDAAVRQASDDEVFDFGQIEKATTKGMAVFWCGLFITLPISLAVLGAVFSAFGLAYIALFGMIAALIIGMIAIIAAGSVISLVGIIYGITQLFSFTEAGIYEIGLGIIVAGAVLLISVLIFNIAIRLLPIIIKKLSVFFAFVLKKIKEAFFALRRECYKL